MSLYVFNNQQKVIKVLPYKRLVEATQEIELNGTDELTVEIPNKDWNKLKEEPLYLAVRDTSNRFSFHMYKILQEDTQDDTVTVKGIQVGYDEMKAYGYIQDRRFTQASMQSVANVIVEGTDWQTGFVDSDLPAITTNFYYISRLEAIRKVIEANGCEIRFRVEITGNRIVAKRIDFLKRMSSDRGKRFSYGDKLLSVVKEKDSAELYTALVGRGKGEEVGDGYGRRIGFEGVEWSVANGDPVDKPIGQEFVELPDMTALYGYPDGEPRTGIVTFEDTEDAGVLLAQTYEQLVNASRPQVQFKATVQLIGDAELGETVSIIRHDLNFKYKTRIFKVKRDLLNNNRTEIELGDRITESLGRTIRRIDTTNQRREERIVEYIQNTADGKNRIFRQTATPATGMTVNDLWYKPVGEGETELYRWNGNIWELEKVSAGLLAGELDAENGDVNLINVNVANIVGDTSEFVQSWWNGIDASISISAENGIQTIGVNGDRVKFTQGEIDFQRGSQGRHLQYNPEGLILTPYSTNTGTSLNTALILKGITNAAENYIQFEDPQFNHRIRQVSSILQIEHANIGELRILNRSGDNGVIRAGIFSVRNDGDNQIMMIGDRIQTPRNSTRDIYLSPNGQGKVRVANVDRDYYPIRASDFENASSRELKTAIEPYRGSALDVINGLDVVEYYMKKDIREGHYNRYVGLISEDSPEVASQDGQSIMSYAVDAYLIKAVQELSNQVKELESHVFNGNSVE